MGQTLYIHLLLCSLALAPQPRILTEHILTSVMFSAPCIVLYLYNRNQRNVKFSKLIFNI
jgi:hypothetical protein